MTDTTKQNVQQLVLTETDAAYQAYMTAFRRAKIDPSPENQRAAIDLYKEYIAVKMAYVEGSKGLNLFRRSG
jgi:hypothetical protein